MNKLSLFNILSTSFIFSIVSKGLSLLAKMLLARRMNELAMSSYTLVSPTMMLCITLAQFALPSVTTSIFARANTHKYGNTKVIIFIALFNNILLCTILFLLIPFLSNIYLKDARTSIVFYSILLLLPFVTISGILKGYFQGKCAYTYVLKSGIIEELSRLTFIYFCMKASSPYILAALAITSITVGEIMVSIYLFFHLPLIRNLQFLKTPISINDFKSVYEECLPLCGSRVISTIVSFLEPYIISFSNQASYKSYYGILHGYFMPLLFIPNFIISSFAIYIVPRFIHLFTTNKIKDASSLLRHSCICIGILSLLSSTLLYFFPSFFFHITFQKDLSFYLNEFKFLIFPLFFTSFQGIISSILHGIGYHKEAFYDSLLGSIIKIICYITLPILNIRAITLALALSLLTTSCLHYYRLICILHFHK